MSSLEGLDGVDGYPNLTVCGPCLNNLWIFVLFLVFELFLDLGFCFHILFLAFECANN